MAAPHHQSIRADVEARKRARFEQAKRVDVTNYKIPNIKKDIKKLLKMPFEALYPPHIVPQKMGRAEHLKTLDIVKKSDKDPLLISAVVEAVVQMRVEATTRGAPDRHITLPDLDKAYSFFSVYNSNHGEPISQRSKTWLNASYEPELSGKARSILGIKKGTSVKQSTKGNSKKDTAPRPNLNRIIKRKKKPLLPSDRIIKSANAKIKSMR